MKQYLRILANGVKDRKAEFGAVRISAPRKADLIHYILHDTVHIPFELPAEFIPVEDREKVKEANPFSVNLLTPSTQPLLLNSDAPSSEDQSNLPQTVIVEEL